MSIQVRVDDETEFKIRRSAKEHRTTQSAEVRSLITQALEQRAFAERLLAQVREAHLQFEDRFFQRVSDTQRAFEERMIAAVDMALRTTPMPLEKAIEAAFDKVFNAYRGS